MNFELLQTKINEIQESLDNFKLSLSEVNQVKTALIDYKTDKIKHDQVIATLDSLDAVNVLNEFNEILLSTKKMYSNLNSPELNKRITAFESEKKEIEKIYKKKEFLEKKQQNKYNCRIDCLKVLQHLKINTLIENLTDEDKKIIAQKLGWEVAETLDEQQEIKFAIIFDNIENIYQNLLEKAIN